MNILSIFKRRLPQKPRLKLSQWDVMPCVETDTVFIGDSILALGEWGELLHPLKICNRAISGSTIGDTLGRLHYSRGAGRIVISCGINDLKGGVDYSEALLQFETLLEQTAGSQTLVIPLIPLNVEIFRRVLLPHYPKTVFPATLDVEIFNRSLESRGARLVDASSLLNVEGQLDARYTDDGLHPNGAGFLRLAQILRDSLPDSWSFQSQGPTPIERRPGVARPRVATNT